MADIPVNPQPGPQPTPRPADDPKLPGQDPATEMPKGSDKEDIDESESTGGSALEQEAGGSTGEAVMPTPDNLRETYNAWKLARDMMAAAVVGEPLDARAMDQKLGEIDPPRGMDGIGRGLRAPADVRRSDRSAAEEIAAPLKCPRPDCVMPEEPMSPTAAAEDGSQLNSDQGIGAPVSAPPDGFANLEDKGRWLTFRVARADSSVPARITREAMEDHFEAGKGDKSLAEAYLQHSETINAKVLELAPSGDVYSTENPLKLSTGDFE